MQDNLIVVGKKDNILGFEEKAKCHSGKGILHRAFSTFIFNNKGELLLQQRSQYKQGWPFFWSNSCCSHPRKDERILQAAKKRLQKELGFTANLKYLYKFYYRSVYKKTFSENEICYVCLGNYNDDDIKPDPKEVKDWKWIKIDLLQKDIEKNPKKYTPWFKKIMKELERQKIFKKRKVDGKKAIKVIIAKPHGFCGNDNFGVVRAISIIRKTVLRYPGKTYLLGEIIHNEHVVSELKEKYGVKVVNKIEEIPEGAVVIIRTHGEPPSIYKQAKEKNLLIIDATCPLVSQAHKEVKKLAEDGKKIIYIASKKDHEEAVGVFGEAPNAVTLVTLEELDRIKITNPANTVVVTQTTLSILETQKSLDNLVKKYPEISVRPHICLATTARQQAIIDLAKKIGFVIIVGAKNSSNANRLKEVAESAGAKAYIIDNATELNPNWFNGIDQVAVSSGASTPEKLLKAVCERIKNF